MLVQLGFIHLGSSIYNLPPPGGLPHYPYSLCSKAFEYRENQSSSRKGFQPFPMVGGKDDRLVCPDALAARPHEPKSLLR